MKKSRIMNLHLDDHHPYNLHFIIILYYINGYKYPCFKLKLIDKFDYSKYLYNSHPFHFLCHNPLFSLHYLII